MKKYLKMVVMALVVLFTAATTKSAQAQTFSYLKASNRFYVTPSGSGPTAAGYILKASTTTGQVAYTRNNLSSVADSVTAATTIPITARVSITSTTKPTSLCPKMTVAQRDAITSPAAGDMVYVTDSSKTLSFYNGTVWKFVTTD
jgi:hypothetical protein